MSDASTARQLLDDYRSGAHSPVEALEDCFTRIAEDDPTIGSMWAIDHAGARAAAEVSAQRWRAGTARSLEGVPIAVKDLLDTAGLRTTGGSRWLEGRVPRSDAAVVAVVRACGAVVVGKTATFELGCGDEDIPFGAVHNPWNAGCTTGGSSAGSAAALAAGFVPLALGTDTGGSIRIPASYCGVVGLKPTLGRLSCAGLLGLSPTLDTPGPMAGDAADLSLLFAALVGGDPNQAAPRSLTGLRIGVVRPWFCELLADDVEQAFENALEALSDLGASVVDVAVRGAEESPTVSYRLTLREAASLYRDAPRDLLGASLSDRLADGAAVSDELYGATLLQRQRLTAETTKAFDRCDVLVVPASVSTAPPLVDLERPVAGVTRTWAEVIARTMVLWNVTGLPAVSVPIGFGTDGLPIGMQLVGRAGADESLLSIATTFQTVSGHRRIPTIPPRGT